MKREDDKEKKLNNKFVLGRKNHKKSSENSDYSLHTDLALEEREKFKRNVEIPGVVLKKTENKELDMCVTKMEINDKKASQTMGKPEGTYITIESRLLVECDEEEKDDKLIEIISGEIQTVIKDVLKDKKTGKVLIAGLGNENATPDALGPETTKLMEIKPGVLCIAPGVLAQTGMETYKIIKGIVKEEKPDVVIAIDSLAARNVARVATTIQITDTGIIPGSGVGNHRMGLNEDSLNVPVVAIGVPMVVNSVTIVHDTIEQLLGILSNYKELEDMTKGFSIFNKEEKYHFIDEIMSQSVGKMYVTPKDVDEIIFRISRLLSKSINMAVSTAQSGTHSN